MKKIVLFMGLISVVLLAELSMAQVFSGGGRFLDTEGGLVMGGVGFSSIDDQQYVSATFRPELAIGKVGIGLNVDLRFNTDGGGIRDVDWDSRGDYFRVIRYIRYGRKKDPVYVRVGTLDAVRLGHGFIMNFYTNEADYDRRKIGLVFDLDQKLWGFESMTSNLGRLELIGGRAFVRPLRELFPAPILKNFTIGGTFVRDVDPDEFRDTPDGVSVWGLDAGLPIITTPIFETGVYYDFAKIVGHGSGSAVGVEATLHNLGGIVEVTGRLERRFLGKNFMPTYFDAFYEVDRFVPIGGGLSFRKEDQLRNITKTTRGTFGEVSGTLLKTIQLIAFFQRLDGERNSGTLHAAAIAPKAVIPNIALHAEYDKTNIETFEDVRTLDNRSIARAGAGYRVRPWLLLYMDYVWSFQFNEKRQRYEPQERFEPRLALVYNFPVKK